MDICNVSDFGQQFQEHVLRKALLELCPDLIFDPAGKLGYSHPNMHMWQGIWHLERHIATMDRGPVIPEFDVWSVVELKTGRKIKHRIYRVGWRSTLQVMVDKPVPGITWERLCRKLKVPMKIFTGSPADYPTLEFNYSARF